MKIHILSDLHLEFASFKSPETDADIVVLAGDIHLGQKGLEWAQRSFSNKTVIYVLGNHEYYGNAIPKLVEQLRQKTVGTQIRILENESFEIGNFKFLGCTLWTDFRLFGTPCKAGCYAKQKINDYHNIKVSPKFNKLRPIDTELFHYRSLRWLQNELNANRQKQPIIITHHAPSLSSIPIIYRSHLLSAAFASCLDDFIKSTNAHLWIHGHVHNHFDYQLGNTRVICNPRGYPGERFSNFNPALVVEV